MLEEASDDGADGDVLADAGDAGPQAADAANDEVDFRAGLRGGVERFDEFLVHEGVHLGDDPRRFAGARGGGFVFDVGHHRLVCGEGCEDEFLRALKVADAGEEVEEIRGVLTEVGLRGEEGEVGVKAGGAGVVVAGAEVDVAAQAVVVAPHDEGDLAVDLVVHDAIDDVDAGFLEAARPSDVVRLVEARFQLGDGGDLLAIAHGVHERADDARVAAGAVERLFDGEDVRIGGGLLQKIHDAGETLIRVMHEHVALADDGEEIAGAAEGGRDRGDERFVPQLRRVVALVDGHEAHGVERAVDDVEVVPVEFESLEEKVGDVSGTGGLDFEAHGGAFAAVVQLVLDRLEQVVDVSFVDVEFAVPGDAEMPEAEDFRPRKEVGEIVADEVAEVDEIAAVVLARQTDEAREDARHLDHGEAAVGLAVARDFELHDDVEGLVQELGKGVRRIDAERGEHGAHVGAVVLLHPGAVRGFEVLVIEEVDLIFCERGEEFVAPAAVLLLDHGAHAAADGAEGFAGGLAIHAALHDIALNLLLQAGHADLEKLVEVRAGDDEKLHALEQRIRGVERLVEHPLVEFQPTQFAADKVGSVEGFHGARQGRRAA